MRVIASGIIALFLVSPAVALSTSHPGYELKCAGKLSALGDAGANAPAAPFAMTLHVDLDKKSFCQDSCEIEEKISKILPSNIIFRAVAAPLPNRLWVADSGQFSYTWAEAAARDDKPSMHSAQGFCSKVMVDLPNDEKENIKPRSSVSKPPIGYKLADQTRSRGLSEGEIRALINIQRHRPVSAEMHTRLWLKGLAEFDNDSWVLTDKGETIMNGR